MDCAIRTEIKTDHWNSVRAHITNFRNTMSTKAELLFTENGCNLTENYGAVAPQWRRSSLDVGPEIPIPNKVFWVFQLCLQKLRKETFSFVTSICPSARIVQLCSKWKDFHEIWYLKFLNIFQESSSFIYIWQEKRVLYVKTYVLYTYENISLNYSCNEKYFGKNLIKKIKKHILYSMFFFRKSWRLW
jgi:hypothetical protein